MIDTIVSNIAIIAVFLVIWQLLADRIDPNAEKMRAITIGVLLGASGVFSIMSGYDVLPGIVIDLRTATVASAAFFGGPIGAVIAGVMTSAYRVSVGGGGVIPSMVAIWSSIAFALFLRHRFSVVTANARVLLMLSAGVSVGYGFAYAFIPAEKLVAVFSATFAPMFVLNFLTTFGIASMVAYEMKRQELVRTNAAFRRMVEVLPDPLIAKDRNGRILAANPAAALAYGVDPDEDLIGQKVDHFVSNQTARLWEKEMAQVLESGEALYTEQFARTAGLEGRWVATRKVAFEDEQKRRIGIVIHVRDITRDKQLLDMKSEFVSLVSHELRTPLTSVRGSLGLLTKVIPKDISKSAADLLSIATRNSERLVRLINDILDAEKIENGSLEFDPAPHELAPLIETALPTFQKYLPDQNINVAFIDESEGAAAMIDPVRFEQVLANLVSNAIKFSKDGGTVTIALRHVAEDIVISVQDFGAGIPKHFQPHLFERFQQGDGSDRRLVGGTGLGLHIAKIFVERMDGKLAFETEEGEGTTFFISLPLISGTGKRKVEKPSAGTPLSNRSFPRVLYVEDDPSLGAIIKAMTSSIAHLDHVTSLSDAKTNLAETDYDLLIIDDELPDGSGLTLLQGAGKNIQSIIFTAREVKFDAQANVRQHFIKTRVSEAEVFEAIRSALIDLPKAA